MELPREVVLEHITPIPESDFPSLDPGVLDILQDIFFRSTYDNPLDHWASQYAEGGADEEWAVGVAAGLCNNAGFTDWGTKVMYDWMRQNDKLSMIPTEAELYGEDEDVTVPNSNPRTCKF